VRMHGIVDANERLTFEHNGIQRRLTNAEGHLIHEILARRSRTRAQEVVIAGCPLKCRRPRR
jgi:hypothetical protein